MPTKESLLRTQFLDYLFGEQEGWVCLATGTPIPNARDKFNQQFFRWPLEKELASDFIEGARSKNVWFGINLLDSPERTKEHCMPTDLVWADLDSCDPGLLTPSPQLVLETSKGRFQAIWRLTEQVNADIAEEFSRRIYQKWKLEGVDAGWHLTKLLRVPYTFNFKYQSRPEVLIHRADEDRVDPFEFESLIIEELKERGDTNKLPSIVDLPEAETILYKYREQLMRYHNFASLYELTPEKDWSSALWNLIKICLECGMSKEECLVIAVTSKCNKYERDKRPLSHLWLDIVRADDVTVSFKFGEEDIENSIAFPELINEDELEQIHNYYSFITKYISWASEVTDASRIYHEISGCVLLSCLLADKLHLNVSWGKIIPNLWALLLGESTLSRKTTAMELAMEFVLEHDPQILLSTQDSSSEGMFTALAERPERVSVFHRDEVSGFFSAMASKSYLAGMAETMTKLYDVPPVLIRQLRKETITVNKPIFVFFGGGIKERVYEALTDDFFTSGFLPRFLVVNGTTDVENLNWIGPPIHNATNNHREEVRLELGDIINNYQTQIIATKILGQEATIHKQIEAVLSNEAWTKMRKIEQALVLTANDSHLSGVALPTYTRLSTSILKMSMLFAASRQEPKDFQIQVEIDDVLYACKLVQSWSPHIVDMMLNVGTTQTERTLQAVLRTIRNNPGITRSDTMRRHKLQSLPAKMIFSTLEERGLITAKQAGKGYRIWAT